MNFIQDYDLKYTSHLIQKILKTNNTDISNDQQI